MIQYFKLAVLLTLSAILFSSCNKDVIPTNTEDYSVSEGKKFIEFTVEKDLTANQKSPHLRYTYSELKLNGVDLASNKWIYPKPGSFLTVDCEFNVAVNDSFIVEIAKCKKENNWFADSGEKTAGAEPWLNNEISLLRIDKTYNSDSSYNCKFVFKVLKPGKGYIAFIEKDKAGNGSSGSSHGLFIGYNVNPMQRVFVNFQEVEWIYNNSKYSFSTVAVRLKGTTNAYRLRCRTSGDGLLSSAEIPVINGHFEKTIGIAFSNISELRLTTNSELAVYGTVGLPKIISLLNPEAYKEKPKAKL